MDGASSLVAHFNLPLRWRFGEVLSGFTCVIAVRLMVFQPPRGQSWTTPGRTGVCRLAQSSYLRLEERLPAGTALRTSREELPEGRRCGREPVEAIPRCRRPHGPLRTTDEEAGARRGNAALTPTHGRPTDQAAPDVQEAQAPPVQHQALAPPARPRRTTPGRLCCCQV